MKLATESTVTPEFLVASTTHTKSEKLDLLENMRRKALERSRQSDSAEAGPSIGTIDRAIDKVKAEAEDRPGAAMSRTNNT